MKIELTKEVRARMASCLVKAKQREIGGILMGEQLKPGEFRVIDFSLDDTSGSATQFVRLPERHNAVLDAFFTRTGNDYARFNYLGEWHSHPNYALAPSAIDIITMHNLLDEENNIPFAILLIVKKGWCRRFKCSATLFNRNKKMSRIQVIKK